MSPTLGPVGGIRANVCLVLLFAIYGSIWSLPECSDEKSVCGYVQLNSMGISSQPICKCKGPVQCPLIWNPMDGRTVSHGNDQYKV